MPRSWPDKFRDAFRGLWLAVRGERSFVVHLPMAAAVAVLAAVLRVSLVEACLLGLCVAIVLAAELFNTALERLSRAIDREPNEHLAGARHRQQRRAGRRPRRGGAGGAIFVYRVGLLAAWWTGAP